MQYSSAIRKSKLVMPGTTGVTPNNIMLSQKSQTQNSISIIRFICNSRILKWLSGCGGAGECLRRGTGEI